MSMSNNTYHI